MGATLPIRRFRARLSEIIQRVERGETVILTKNGRPVVELRRAQADIWDQLGVQRPARRGFKPRAARIGGLSGFVLRERRRRAF